VVGMAGMVGQKHTHTDGYRKGLKLSHIYNC